MFLQPNASMPTTRPCRSWPRARPAPADCGPMCATTGPLPAPIRRPQCSSIRAIVAASTLSNITSYTGLMQADAYAGFNRLYEANRKPGPIVEGRPSGQAEGADGPALVATDGTCFRRD